MARKKLKSGWDVFFQDYKGKSGKLVNTLNKIVIILKVLSGLSWQESVQSNDCKDYQKAQEENGRTEQEVKFSTELENIKNNQTG